jgi:integrase
MSSLKLTKRAIERLSAPDPSGKQTLHWDAELKGFGVLCSGASAAKTFIVQRKLPGGVTRRVTVGAVNALDLDDARARAREVLAEFYQGKDPKAERREAARRGKTLRAALGDYLTAREGISERSRAGYRASVDRELGDWLDRPLREISPEMVEKHHRAIAAGVAERSGGTRRGGGPANGAATANGTMRALRAVYNYAAERDPTLPPNPVSRLRRAWFAVPRRERLVRGDDLPAFHAAVNALPSRTARDYLLLLLYTGMRRGEAGALRWDEVDFAARLIRLPAARTKARRKLDLPMSSLVRDLLVARRALEREGQFVFPASSRSGHVEDPKAALREVAAATGIEVSAHDLRRTFATAAEGADISPSALKVLVNHSLGTDVTAGYIIMTVERLREPAQRVADRLAALCALPDAPEVKKLAG